MTYLFRSTTRLFKVVRAHRASSALVILALVVGGGYVWNSQTTALSAYSEQELALQKSIRSLGAEAAYARFAEDVRAHDIQTAHTRAHIFGAALFAIEGKDGISVCDDAFAFGCLHEMFERIIDEYGINDLGHSVMACKEARGAWHPCHHALGHGLIAYLGYDEGSIRKALEICDKDFNEDPINGCVGGVFMEYNLYTTAGPTIDPRPLDERGWFYPCTAIDPKFHKACYFWLPQWWRVSMMRKKMESPAIFSKMGELCDTLPHPEFERECIERVGQHATYAANFKPDDAKKYCTYATQNEKNRFLCHSYSAFSFRYTDERFAQEALEMCTGFSGEQKEFCEKFARNEANIGTAPPLPDEFTW